MVTIHGYVEDEEAIYVLLELCCNGNLLVRGRRVGGMHTHPPGCG